MIGAADRLVAQMAAEIKDGDVVATGVASPLAVLAIAVARATHAPTLTYLACVGSLDPHVTRLLGSSEDLAYLDGRSAEITIPDLFDHARKVVWASVCCRAARKSFPGTDINLHVTVKPFQWWLDKFEHLSPAIPFVLIETP